MINKNLRFRSLEVLKFLSLKLSGIGHEVLDILIEKNNIFGQDDLKNIHPRKKSVIPGQNIIETKNTQKANF